MTATEALSPVQFMSAREIISTHVPNDRLMRDTDNSSVWARKLEESRQPNDQGARPDGTSSVYEGVERQGVNLGSRTPVFLQHPGSVMPGESPRVFDGHHRIAALSHLLPDAPIPVQYTKSSVAMHMDATLRRKAARINR
jgi:hypothetical protein